MPLPETIPDWVAGYVGLPFKSQGRDRDGLDCWGLVRLVYAERYGVMLPSYLELYEGVDDSEGIASIFARDIGDQRDWQPIAVDECRVGDLACFVVGGKLRHVGLMVSLDRMLHAHAGTDSCVERVHGAVWGSRLAHIVRHGGPVRVRGVLNPLQPQRIDAAIPAGLTLTEILAAVGIPDSPCLRAYIGDVSVPRSEWAHVRPRPGRLVTLAAVPLGGGSGKSPMRTIATLAILAAAAAIPGAGFAAGWGLLGAGGALTLKGSLVVGGVGLVGSLLVNALIPPPKPRLSDLGGDRVSNTITGARNEVRLYQPVPRVLGTHRIAPPYAALPYTELVGDDQYLRLLFDVGPGPLDISDHKIGDTDIAEYDGVELEVRPGRDDDDPITLYPGIVIETPLSILLRQEDSWVTRTSAPNADELSIDVTFPTGLAEITGSGSRRNRTVSLEVEYSPVGAGDWRRVNERSPSMAREMDVLFRGPEAELITPTVPPTLLQAPVAWGAGFAGAKPAYLPADNYSWEAVAYLVISQAGEYAIGIDCADAGDVSIDGRVVASWYGTHGTAGWVTPDYEAHHGLITLRRGVHRLRIRIESRSPHGGAIAVGWRRPCQPTFEAIPATAITHIHPGFTGFLRVRAFSVSAYTGSLVVTESRTEPFRRSLAWAVPRGQYDVRIRRVTPDSTSDRHYDQVYWTALRTIRNEHPVRTRGHALVAMRIKATDQLNGVVDEYNCLASSVVQDWDADVGEWVERQTSNPASLYRAVLQSRGNARPVPDARLDLSLLQSWHEACTAAGYAFNAVIDTKRTVWEVLADIAAAGRAAFGVLDGLFGVVRDQPQSVPVQHFTPRNSTGFRGRRAFPDLPHALRVRFLNAAEGYQQDERIVYDDGYNEDNATRFEQLELYGVTDADLAWKHGRYHTAVARLRPETYELGVDVEHLVCTRGDLVLVTHDVPQWGLGQARVSDLVVDTSDNLLGLALDAAVPMDIGDYAVRVRLEDGTSWVRSILTEAGEQTVVMFGGPVAPSEPRPKVGDLVLFGRLGQESRELVVRAVAPGPNLTATLILVDHAPAVHQADQGPIPPWESGITRPPAMADRPDTPIIESIRSDDGVMIREADGSLRDRMLITLRRPSGTAPIPTHAQVRIRRKPEPPAVPAGPWRHLPLTPIDAMQVSVEEVESGVTYEIRLRTVTAAGKTSAWAEAEHTIVGKTLPPPDVELFDVFRLADGTRRFTWTIATDVDDIPRDLAGFRVRYGPVGYTWDQLTPLHAGLWQSSPTDSIDPPAGTWKIGIKAVDTSGNESRNATFVTRDLGEPPLPGAAFTLDERVNGWPGTKTGCVVASTGALESIDLATWDTLASLGAATWDTWPRWFLSPTSPISYESEALDAGVVFEFSPDCLVTGDGTLTVELAWSDDDVTYSDWMPAAEARIRLVEARYLKARITCASNSTHQIPVIRTCLLVMRADTIEHEHQDLDTSGLGGAYRIGVGDVRLPLPFGRFSVVRNVAVSFNGAGAGWSWEVIDRDAAVGPRIRIYDDMGDPADAVIDAVIRGI